MPGAIDISFNSTVPVGVPVPEVFATIPVNVTLAPMVEEVGPARVTVVPPKLGAPVAQLLSKLATFNVPSPVAKSYPAVALNAGVVPPAAVVRMPNCPAVLLLQFGVPPTHATELLPLATS